MAASKSKETAVESAAESATIVVPEAGTDEAIERAREDATKKEARDLDAEQREIDRQRGYRRRVLANGVVDFVALHDHWTSPSERTMQEHVAGYFAATSNYLVEPTIITKNE